MAPHKASIPPGGPKPKGPSPAELGLYIAMASMGMLFAASLVAYFVTRAQSEVWRTTEIPELPWGLWISTSLLLALSWTLRAAERALGRNAFDQTSKKLSLSLTLVFVFLASQALNYRFVHDRSMEASQKSLYAFTFYLLTAIHAIHVIFGIVPLLIALKKTRDGEYSSSRTEGLRLVRKYWDFLLIVWIFLFVSLLAFA